MICAGCQRELEPGDQYIAGQASEYVGKPESAEIDDLMAEILGDGKRIIYCEDCTEPGGDFKFATYYGDDDPGPLSTRGI